MTAITVKERKITEAEKARKIELENKKLFYELTKEEKADLRVLKKLFIE